MEPKENLKESEGSVIGVPTFEIFSSEQAGGYIFCTVFHEDFKNVFFLKIGPK